MKRARFTTPARDFKSTLETGGPTGAFAEVGDPGDRLADCLRLAIADLWRGLNVPPDDRPYLVDATVWEGSSLGIFIRPDHAVKEQKK
jgi:hypothetical protein